MTKAFDQAGNRQQQYADTGPEMALQQQGRYAGITREDVRRQDEGIGQHDQGSNGPVEMASLRRIAIG
ncbi:hypothetical protein [Salinicola acroporae]|uniref:hypothetical protein n=1 Tax=Salinicola acroporae TaxID=1541440 RepID=UPI00245409FF|nr:hypothetical protein [Salinicola acroporae]